MRWLSLLTGPGGQGDHAAKFLADGLLALSSVSGAQECLKSGQLLCVTA